MNVKGTPCTIRWQTPPRRTAVHLPFQVCSTWKHPIIRSTFKWSRKGGVEANHCGKLRPQLSARHEGYHRVEDVERRAHPPGSPQVFYDDPHDIIIHQKDCLVLFDPKNRKHQARIVKSFNDGQPEVPIEMKRINLSELFKNIERDKIFHSEGKYLEEASAKMTIAGKSSTICSRLSLRNASSSNASLSTCRCFKMTPFAGEMMWSCGRFCRAIGRGEGRSRTIRIEIVSEEEEGRGELRRHSCSRHGTNVSGITKGILDSWSSKSFRRSPVSGSGWTRRKDTALTG